jgi:hypothetical protein
VKLHPVTQLILFAALVWLTSDIIVVTGVIHMATDPAWARFADRSLLSTARAFGDIATALSMIGVAVWVEGISRWAEALKANRLAKLTQRSEDNADDRT